MSRWWRGVLGIAAAYIYFLIFAQFAFLTLLTAQSEPAEVFEKVMGAMGLAGLLGSLLVAMLLKRVKQQNILATGFILAGITAFFSPAANSEVVFILLAAAIGVSLSMITVSLASGLLRYSEVARLGLLAGTGTGIAYFICNIPWVFSSSASQQSYLATVVALLGLGACVGVGDDTQNRATAKGCKTDYQKLGFFSLVLMFLALVWLDSAAFFVIQQSGELRSLTWEGTGRLWFNAGVHLVAAVFAGVLFDKGIFRAILLAAFFFLSLGVLTLESSALLRATSGPLYCVGVSLYSTLLVAFPARFPEDRDVVTIPWRAGILYAVAGWFGSAMGIGMARDLATVPKTFLLVAGGLMLLCAFWGAKQKKAVSSVTLLLAVFCFGCPQRALAEKPLADYQRVARGRQVYIAEGCIHCHSQFVRPNSRDEEMWGPYIPAEDILRQRPPLIGNRRAGPDLLNVGNRRSRDWLKIHLITPRATQPGSTMPSYAYLFENQRGSYLLDYLQSLGRETISKRLKQIKSWRPKKRDKISRAEAEELFKDACAACHGKEGRGNGPLARQLVVQPRNLRSEKPRSFDSLSEDADINYARVIKFGIVGSSMPGHEYYEDDEVLGLVEYVKSLLRAEEK